jgi:endoglucanase
MSCIPLCTSRSLGSIHLRLLSSVLGGVLGSAGLTACGSTPENSTPSATTTPASETSTASMPMTPPAASSPSMDSSAPVPTAASTPSATDPLAPSAPVMSAAGPDVTAPTATSTITPLPTASTPETEPSGSNPEPTPSASTTGSDDPSTQPSEPEPTTEPTQEPPSQGLPWQAAITTEVDSAELTQGYQAWVAAYVQDCEGTDTAVVIKDGGQVVSEGIAYGMLLSVGQNDQTLFDKLWRFYLAHLDENGLMNWSMEVCAAAGDNDSGAATDGDLDAAMALVQAASVWGGDYLQAAETLTQNILAHETVTCDGRLVLKPGDVWGGCEDASGETRINPSYFAPGYYRVFAHYFSDQAVQWTELLDGSYELYALYQARMDGLFPDWSDSDGADWYGSSYSYDACRTPWRVAVDYAWSGDARAQTTLQGVSARVASAGGIPLADFPNNSAFQGALALAHVTDASAFDTAMSRWLGAGGDDKPYFQGTLRLLYLQVALGLFPSTL